MRHFIASLVGNGGGGATEGKVSFGFVTDLHWADLAPYGGGTPVGFPSIYYRDARLKLADAITYFNARNLDFVVVNGDITDGGTDAQAPIRSEQVTGMGQIDSDLSGLTAPYKITIGNHDCDKCNKQDNLDNYTGFDSTYYSYDIGDFRMAHLDSCYYADDNGTHYEFNNWRDYTPRQQWIPPAERTWLSGTALDTTKNVIVFCHHPLHDDSGNNYSVTNDNAIRSLLETAGNVVAVFTGHEHINTFETVNSIPYYGMAPLSKDADPANAYAVIEVTVSGGVTVTGTDNQTSYP